MTSLAVALIAASTALSQADTEPAGNYRLKQFEWWIGSWESEVELPEDVGAFKKGVKYRFAGKLDWILDRHFIRTDAWVEQDGEVISSNVMIMAWNTALEAFEDWGFSSDGSITHRLWTPLGANWRVSTTIALPNGEKDSFTQILEDFGPQQHQWTITVQDGRDLPAPIEFVFTRVDDLELKTTEGDPIDRERYHNAQWWVGGFLMEGGGDAGPTRVGTQTGRMILNGNFLESKRITVNPEQRTRSRLSIGGWDPASKQSAGWEYSSSGYHGRYSISDDGTNYVVDGTSRRGTKFIVNGTMTDVDENTKEYRAEMTRSSGEIVRFFNIAKRIESSP